MRWIPLALCVLAILAVPAFSQSIFDAQNPKPPPAPSAGHPTPQSQPAVSPAPQPAGTDSPNGTTEGPKLPVPDAAALRAAATLVKHAYGDDIAAARTPDEKTAMLQKLLNAANDKKGANRYALLVAARDLAVGSGDIARCDWALDGIEASFDVGSPKLRSDAYAGIARNVRLPADQTKLCQDISATVHAATIADQFGIAAPIADLGLRTARTAGDPALVKQAMADVEAARATENAYAGIQKALVVLAGKPGDPDANLSVGRYRCFVKGDWQSGLPMLASANDATLKALAVQELAGVTTTDEQVKLGDGWWNFGGNESGLSKQEILSHAGTWYEQALPQMRGLAKAKVEKRLQGVEVAAGHTHKAIDLLKLVDTRKDTVRGKFSLRDGELAASGGGQQRIQFNYRPPEEYDFYTEFTKTNAGGCVIQILSKNQSSFIWVVGVGNQPNCTFHYLKGGDDFHNKTTVRLSREIDVGVPYRSLVQVRNTGTKAFLDGELVDEWKTDYTDINERPFWQLRDNSLLGLGVDGNVVFHVAEVTEISGEGKTLNGQSP